MPAPPGGPSAVPVLTLSLHKSRVSRNFIVPEKRGVGGNCEGPGAVAISGSLCFGVIFTAPSMETQQSVAPALPMAPPSQGTLD